MRSRAFWIRVVVAVAVVVAIILLLIRVFPFTKQKAGLQVMTNDVPSSVFLNGQYLEKTPYIGKDFKPGEYTLKIQPDDPALISHETTIKLQSGLLTVMTWKPGNRPETSGGVMYEMEKLANKNQTQLSIISIPDGAITTLDEGNRDFTPMLVESIAPGQHEFEVTLPSYETQKHTINVIMGHRMNVTVKLSRSAEALGNTVTNTETASSSGAAVLGASISATPKPKPSPSASTSASPSAMPVRSANKPVSGSTVTILSTGYMINGQEVLRVRDQASSSGKELGFAPVGEVYSYLQESVSGWHKINFNNQPGWVNSQYAEVKN